MKDVLCYSIDAESKEECDEQSRRADQEEAQGQEEASKIGGAAGCLEAVGRGLEQLDEYIASEPFEAAMGRRAGDLIDAVADEPIAGVLTPTRGAGHPQAKFENAHDQRAEQCAQDRAAPAEE